MKKITIKSIIDKQKVDEILVLNSVKYGYVTMSGEYEDYQFTEKAMQLFINDSVDKIVKLGESNPLEIARTDIFLGIIGISLVINIMVLSIVWTFIHFIF
jgi:hypothetical protein